MEFFRKIRLKLQRRKYGIISVNIETISTCNRTCSFCFNDPRFEKRPQGKMETETFHRIIDQLAEINFSGRIGPHFFNEPLLDARLPELIKYTCSKLPWAWIQINSNGDFLREDNFLELLAAGVNYFFITNYDETEKPELNTLQRKYPSYIKVVNNSEMWRTDRGGEIFQKNKVLNAPCLRPSAQLVVNWQGEMLLCCMDFYARYSFGNLETASFPEILNSLKYRSVVAEIAQSRQNGFDICHNCDDPGSIPW
ncbi:MAG: SPASM domain-containing protein [Candidatus Cloacimonetes bacterium]|nr:SPASM domain-containing protein [Candidatus Cloacimonadota bacterium]